MLGFQICSTDIIILAPSMFPSSTRTRCGPKRKLTGGCGSRRKLMEAENGISGTRIGRFSPQIWPMACWVSRYALLISSHCPHPRFHHTNGPEATRNGRRRKIAETSGIRRKLTEGENGRSSTRLGRFSPKIWHMACWVSIYPPQHHHHGPIHVAIGHTDQMRPETAAGGRYRKLTEADGCRKMA